MNGERDRFVLDLSWPATRDLWGRLPMSADLTSIVVHGRDGGDGLEELLPQSVSRGFAHDLTWRSAVGGSILPRRALYLLGEMGPPAAYRTRCAIRLDRSALACDERRSVLRSLDALIVQFQYQPDLDDLIEARKIARKAFIPRIWESVTQ